MMIGDLLDIPTAGLMATRAEVTNNRDRVQKTIAALSTPSSGYAPTGQTLPS